MSRLSHELEYISCITFNSITSPFFRRKYAEYVLNMLPKVYS